MSLGFNRTRHSVVVDSWDQALEGLLAGDIVAFGGFGLSGSPTDAFHAIRDRPHLTQLVAVSSESGIGIKGLGLLHESHQIKRQVCSYIGRCKIMEKAYLTGELELEWRPQGTLAETLRAGAAGIPGVWTPAGANTILETGEVPLRYNKDGTVAAYCPPRESRIYDGVKYLWEPSIHPKFAFVHAKIADRYGNCRFDTTARNFNIAMAQAAQITVVEAETIVEAGAIHPDDVHLASVYVNRVIQADKRRKPLFEHLVFAGETQNGADYDPAKELICRRAAQEFRSGDYVNLGAGMPSDSARFCDKSVDMLVQTENGFLGINGLPKRGEENAALIDAGKTNVVYKPGAAAFDSAESFLQIRGGVLTMTMLGGMEVSQNGDLANWIIPGKKVAGMGGAMDLVSNPKQVRVIVLMKHRTKDGRSRVVKQCSLPLTGARVVSKLITELAVFDIDSDRGVMTLLELAPGVSLDDVRAATDADFVVSPDLKTMRFSRDVAAQDESAPVRTRL